MSTAPLPPSSKLTNIAFQIENQTLHRLIAEQLCCLKNVTSDPDLPPDCLVIDQGKKAPDNLDIPVLEISKAPVILGNIIDQMKYLLSGRESHIEDENDTIDLGEFILRPAQNTLTHTPSQTVIHLTDKERALLKVLHLAGESGLAKTDLLKSVWGYAEAAETHTLETHIYRLRQKLDAFNASDLIKANEGTYLLNSKKPA